MVRGLWRQDTSRGTVDLYVGLGYELPDVAAVAGAVRIPEATGHSLVAAGCGLLIAGIVFSPILFFVCLILLIIL